MSRLSVLTIMDSFELSSQTIRNRDSGNTNTYKRANLLENFYFTLL